MKLRTLRVHVQAPFGRLLMAHSLPRFVRAYTGLHVRLREVDSIVATLASLERGVDAAICAGPIEDDELVARQLATMHYVTCAAPERVERDGIPSDPGDLDPASCIGLLEPHTDCARDWQFQKGRLRFTFSPSGSLAFDDTDMAVAAAVRGGGYIRVLSIAVDRELGAGLLRPVLEDWNDASLPIWIAQPRARAVNEDISAFAAFVSDLLPRPDVDSTVLKFPLGAERRLGEQRVGM